MTYTELLQVVINRLGANYKTDDENVLKSILDEVIANASYISNRDIKVSSTNEPTVVDDNLKLLSPEISLASVIAYLNRGVESLKSQSELGESNSFVDYADKLRDDIIKNGKRVIY